MSGKLRTSHVPKLHDLNSSPNVTKLLGMRWGACGTDGTGTEGMTWRKSEHKRKMVPTEGAGQIYVPQNRDKWWVLALEHSMEPSG
jgi:hypothetical protein